MKRIIVVGGGVAGLGAAYKVKRAAEAGNDVDVVLVEKDPRLGGKLATEIIDDPTFGTFVVDGGSDAFISEKTAVHRVARLLGIFDDETPTVDENKKTLIVKESRLIEMPDGIMMFAPTKMVPMATTKLYSWPAKFRMALDLVIPKKKIAPGELNDETLEHFVVRRMGRECLDRLAEPLVGGVHASDPTKMSLAATFPNLLDMEQKYGSLIRGFLAQRKKVEEIRRKYPHKPGQKRRTFFTSFLLGMQFFTDRMADAIGRENIVVGVSVTSIERSADGRWDIALSDGSRLEGDAVVLATEAWAAEELVRPLDGRVADLLGEIPVSSSATIPIAFKAEDCPFDTKWFGILCPIVENRPLMAITMSSSKWPDRAPDGTVLMRGFVGGPRNQAIMDKSDEELIEIVRSQMVEMLGLKADAKPILARVFRWMKGMPQYTIGHLDRVAEIEERVAGMQGLALAGGSYRGVGVPNCIESGEKAVSKVLAEWGIDLAEDHVEEKRLY
jgi:oxygen-dependent protoporphyrinogen oxidase